MKEPAMARQRRVTTSPSLVTAAPRAPTVGSTCLPVLPGRPPLSGRPLLGFYDAVKVQALFKVLANDTRLRMLHHLVRAGEANVSDLADVLGMKPQAVSNQLQRLADTGVVAWRRDGNNIYYRVVNACVTVLLDVAVCLMEEDGRRAAPQQNSNSQPTPVSPRKVSPSKRK